MGTQGTESSKDFVDDYACVVEEGANYAFDSLDTFFGELRTVRFLVGVMSDLAIDDFMILVRRELVLDGHGMLVKLPR